MAAVALALINIVLDVTEDFACIALQPEGQQRVVPIWTTGQEPRLAAAYVKGYEGQRRRAIDALIDVFDDQGGVEAISLSTYNEGVFLFDVVSASGSSVEVSACDAIILADRFGVDLIMDEEDVAQVAIFTTPEALDEYFSSSYPLEIQADQPATQGDAKGTSASGDPQADADFEAMMRSLGMEDEDFGETD